MKKNIYPKKIDSAVSFKQSKVEESKNLGSFQPTKQQRSNYTKMVEPFTAKIKGQNQRKGRMQQPIRADQKKQKKDDSKYLSKNLSLCDYLKLTSLNRKLSKNKKLSEQNRSAPKQNLSSFRDEKKVSEQDHQKGIKVIYQQTDRQLRNAQTEFEEILRLINTSEQIGEDEESLVFLCNIFNILQERICMSETHIKKLIESQMKDKRQKTLKEYKDRDIPFEKLKPRQSIPQNFSQSIGVIYK